MVKKITSLQQLQSKCYRSSSTTRNLCPEMKLWFLLSNIVSEQYSWHAP